jgi:hypothetical protein
MALGIFDRVRETTTVAGTGTATLLGAVTGYQTFAVVGNGNTTYYCIAGQGTSEWEVGIGTYTSAGTTLARTTVLASSNANALVSFSAGTKDVFVTYPGGKAVYQDASNVVTVPTLTVTGVLTGAEVIASNGLHINSLTVSTSYSVPSGSSAMSVGPITVSSGVAVTIPTGSRWVVL